MTATNAKTSGRTKRSYGALFGFVIVALALLVVAPTVLSDFRLSLLGRFVCYGVVAVGIGLAWGRGGMLTLGQGVFFGLGGYVMAIHLKLADAGPSGVPDFMRLYGSGRLPLWWEPFRSPVVTLLGVALIPSLVALGLGAAIFRRRVRGAYFAILSQALAAAFAILLIGQQTTTGGTNGLNGFRSFFGFNLFDPVNKRMLFFIAAVTLLVVLVIVWQLDRCRYGKLLIAVRDQEERVRFLGYDPANIKIVAYVLAAAMAGVAGALFVPIVGIISPASVGVVPSIDFLIGVAIGGRTTLFGPALGAIAVSWAQTALSESFPSFWSYFQGALFVLVIAFLPAGFSSVSSLRGSFLRSQQASTRTDRSEPPPPPQPSDAVSPHPRPPPGFGLVSAGSPGRSMVMDADYLELSGVRVVFDGFVAVDEVSMTVLRGDLRFLIGPNGAGKTTLVDAITGLAPVTGSVRFGRTELIGKKVHRIVRLGVGRTFQTASVFEELTVAQNLDIAAGAGRSPLSLLRRGSSVPPEVEQALDSVGLAGLRDRQAGELAHGQKQWLEIGMLLVQNARVLLLDEPVAGMSAGERAQTGELLRRIGAERIVVVVEHDMDFMRSFATSVTVLHAGKVLSGGTVAQVQADPRVQEVYLGRAEVSP